MTTQTLKVDFPARWDGLVGIYGGFVLAKLADAAQCVQGFDLTSLTARLLVPVDREPAIITRRIVHHGRRTAALQLTLEQGGRVRIDASAVLVPVGDTVEWQRDAPPAQSGPPSGWVSVPHVQGDLAFARNFDIRTPAAFTNSEGSSAWIRLLADAAELELHSARAVACAVMDALLPVAFGEQPRPEFVPTIEFAVHFTPQVGLITDGWLIGNNRLDWTTDTYCVEDASLTTVDGRLLATQRQTRLIIWNRKETL
jgi:acyl-CoA thioesterase